MKAKSLICLAILSLATSVLAQKDKDPAFDPISSASADKAILYVYWNVDANNKKIGSGTHYTLSVNGTELTVLGRGGYYPYIADPGTIELSTKIKIAGWRPALVTRAFSRAKEITLNVAAGKTYYVKASAWEVGETYQLKLQEVPEDVALGPAEIKVCRLLQPIKKSP